MSPLSHSSNMRTFPVTGMTCAACASSVETILQNTEGIQSAQVNFATGTLRVEWNDKITPERIHTVLEEVGYGLIISEKEVNASVQEEQKKKYLKLKNQTLGAGLFTLPVFVLGMFFMDWEAGKWVSMLLSIPVLVYFGRHFYINAWLQAIHGRTNMDTLVALSTGIAFLYSSITTFFPEIWYERGIQPHVYFEAATVIIFFISLGKLLEERAKSQTGTALKKLIGLQSTSCIRIENGKFKKISIQDVHEGDLILIKPGDKIPVDGKVINGGSFIDESMISGEPLPLEKNPEDLVFAGTINQKGSLQIQAQKVGASTLLSQIIRRVEEAQGSKAPIQKLADKIASVFVPIILGIALLTFGIWIVLGPKDSFFHALLASVSVLVIACPCALGLATPTAIMVGIGKGAENQILIRDAESLELANKVNAVILDKTGTITTGKPTVSQIHWAELPNNDPQDLTRKNLINILGSLEARSEHPLAAAVVNQVNQEGFESIELVDFESITSRGVKGKLQGKSYHVGNLNLLTESNISVSDELKTLAKAWSTEAQTVIWFADNEQALAVIGIKDQVKSSSKSAIQQLQQFGIEVFMLTGDNYQTAAAIALEVGITNFMAEVMPEDKAIFVKNLQESGKIVAMVGDGINDSEALAQADVSIAMGHGSDIVMDIGKITLITSDLEKIPQTLRLSSLTVRGIRQNLFWAFIYNVIGIPIAAGILYPLNGFLLDPMIAGAAMAFSSVSVVLNSLRLKAKNISNSNVLLEN